VAVAFARSRRPFQRSQRRKTSWNIGPHGKVSHSSNTVSIFPIGAQALIDGQTIIRIRGELNMGLSSIAAAIDGFTRVAFGIGIVTENAFSAGVASVPDPLADIAWEGWMAYWTGTFYGVVTATISQDIPANVRVDIDSKAMRKIANTDILMGVFSTLEEVGTATVRAQFSSRILAKLA